MATMTLMSQHDDESTGKVWEVLKGQDIDTLEEQMRTLSHEGRCGRPGSPALSELARGRFAERRKKRTEEYITALREWSVCHKRVQWKNVLILDDTVTDAEHRLIDVACRAKLLRDDIKESQGIIPDMDGETYNLLEATAPSMYLYREWMGHIYAGAAVGCGALVGLYEIVSYVAGKL